MSSYKKYNFRTMKQEEVELDIPQEILDLLKKGFEGQSEYDIMGNGVHPDGENNLWFLISARKSPISKIWKINIKLNSVTDERIVKKQHEEWIQFVKENGIIETHLGHEIVFLKNKPDEKEGYSGWLKHYEGIGHQDKTKELLAKRLVDLYEWIKTDNPEDLEGLKTREDEL